MLFLAQTSDGRFRVGIDSITPDQPACIELHAKSGHDSVTLRCFDHPDDAELAAFFFVDCYNAARLEGFHLFVEEDEWYFKNLAGTSIPIEEAVTEKTSTEFVEILRTAIQRQVP